MTELSTLFTDNLNAFFSFSSSVLSFGKRPTRICCECFSNAGIIRRSVLFNTKGAGMGLDIYFASVCRPSLSRPLL